MNSWKIKSALGAAALAIGSAALGAPVASFGEPLPGWGVGSGQPAGGFNLSTNMSPEVEVGLRSQDYMVGVSANDGLGGNYFVAAGERSPGSGLANWNLDLSLYTGEAVVVGNFEVFLDIDWDPTAGVNIVTYDIDQIMAAAGLTSTNLFQFSENLGFDYWGETFDPFATGTYAFTLRAFEANNPTVIAASTSIFVNVAGGPNDVPEPASLALVGMALGGLALARRRRV